jgi:hypothetical protein
MKISSNSGEIKYPTVQVKFCKDFDIHRDPVGAYYCTKCNTIVLWYATIFVSKEKIVEEVIEILNHETMHWWLYMNIDEETSLGFDMIYEPKKKSKKDVKILNDASFDFTTIPLDE